MMHPARGLIPFLFLTLASLPALAQLDGLVTQPSKHDVRGTLDRFATAVREAGWVVFTEVDHAAAAGAVGMNLPDRTVLLFGNPRAGTGAIQVHPTLAIDLPMRVLVWQNDTGQVFITRSTGADIATRVFARHGVTIPLEGQDATDHFIAELVRKATDYTKFGLTVQAKLGLALCL